MPPSKGPILVRRREKDEVYPRARRSSLWAVRLVLFLAGLGLLGYYGYVVGNQYVYQGFENWAFDQQITGHVPVNFMDYLRAKTPLGTLLGRSSAIPSAPVDKNDEQRLGPSPEHGSVLGRVEIPRLHLAAMVREGVDADTLSKAVGHVPTTALAGLPGNFAIAAHRDTLFRGLKDIQKGDLVTFQSATGISTYRIFSTRIVKPTEVSVLRPDGGLNSFPVQEVGFHSGANRLITLITCYPFYYVGSAPKRFIVQGELVSDTTGTERAVSMTPSPPKAKERPRLVRAHQAAKLREPRAARGSSHLRAVSDAKPRPAVKKRVFWKRWLHVS